VSGRSDTVRSLRDVLKSSLNIRAMSLKNSRKTGYIHTNTMELSPSREAVSRSATQEFHKILCNPKVQYSIHNSSQVVHILSQINPVHTTPFSLSSIIILSSHIRLGLPSGVLPSDFFTNILYAFNFSPVRATCSFHLILLDLMILIILVAEYKF
jgi:hypothetical protein